MIKFDCIKSAYRQTKDGYSLTLVIHPQDPHHAIADAAIGSQWQITAVELDEDGNTPPTSAEN